MEVEKEDSVPATQSFADIQGAQLSALAIPLWYAIGKNHPDSFKYCVITNWWKNRMRDGSYQLPTLDASLYGGTESNTSTYNGNHNHEEVLDFPMEASTALPKHGVIQQRGGI